MSFEPDRLASENIRKITDFKHPVVRRCYEHKEKINVFYNNTVPM